MKKLAKSIGAGLVLSLTFSAMLMAAGTVLQPENALHLKKQEASSNTFIGADGVAHHLNTIQKQTKDGQDATVIVDTVYHYNPADVASGSMVGEPGGGLTQYIEGNTTGVGDTVVTWFTLLTTGQIMKVRGMFASDATPTFGIWAPVFEEDPTDPTSLLRLYPSYPGAQLMIPFATPVPVSASSNADPVWSEFDVAGTFPDNPVVMDSSNFFNLVNNPGIQVWAGYVTETSTGKPGMLMDNTTHDFTTEGVRALATLQSQSTPGSYYYWGNSDSQYSLYWIMQLVVEYEALPPIITGVPNLSNTFATEKTVTADVEKFGEGTITDVSLNYIVYDAATGDETDSGTMAMSNTTGTMYEATLTGAAGDSIEYQVESTDSDGLTSTSPIYNFKVMTPPQDSNINILLIAEADGANHDSIYAASLDRVNPGSYYEWNADDNNGIDASVVNYANFNTIVLFGWGVTSIPMTDEEDYAGYKTFLDNGGNLLFVDMDYFYAHTSAADLTFSAGDFAYDYLGVGTGTSDPSSGGVGTSDVELLGVAGNDLTSNWESDTYGPIEYTASDGDWPNWGDYASANGNATTVFNGSESGEGMGVAYHNTTSGSYTLFLPFAAEMAPDAEFDSLMANFIAWSAPTAIGDETGVPLTFNLDQNYPNPFNPTTQIHYAIPEAGQVTLTVYDLKGNVVKTLVNGKQAANRYTVEWNGTNDLGHKVASGVYLYRLNTDTKVSTKKMTLIR